MPNSKGAGIRVQHVFLGGDIIIIMIKHINNILPKGAKLHLEVETKGRSAERKLLCCSLP